MAADCETSDCDHEGDFDIMKGESIQIPACTGTRMRQIRKRAENSPLDDQLYYTLGKCKHACAVMYILYDARF